MKMETLAYASLRQFSTVSLRLENCQVKARHQFVMQPAPVERFIYITQGDVCFFLEEREVWARERDMVYLPRDTAYRSMWLRSARFVVVDLQLCDEENRDIRFGDAPCVLFHDTHRVYDGLLSELAAKADANGPFDWLERLSLTFKLLCEMARDTAWTAQDEKMHRIEAAVTYLENNFTGDFSVNDLAEMAGFSPGYFRKLFAECKGTTPSDYRNRLRIGRASELLRSGGYTVSEAAAAVGIPDVKYFSKLFQRYTGLKPGTVKNKTALK